MDAAFELIAAEHPHYVSMLALTAFCGMRSFEVHGQRWENFDFERKFLARVAGQAEYARASRPALDIGRDEAHEAFIKAAQKAVDKLIDKAQLRQTDRLRLPTTSQSTFLFK